MKSFFLFVILNFIKFLLSIIKYYLYTLPCMYLFIYDNIRDSLAFNGFALIICRQISFFCAKSLEHCPIFLFFRLDSALTVASHDKRSR